MRKFLLSILIVLFTAGQGWAISGGELPHNYWGTGADGAQSGAFTCSPTNNQPCVKNFTTYTQTSGTTQVDADCMGLFIFATESINLNTGGSITMAGKGFTDGVGGGFVSYSSELNNTVLVAGTSGTFQDKILLVRGGKGGDGASGTGAFNTSSGANETRNKSLSGGGAGGFGTFYSGGIGGGGGHGASKSAGGPTGPNWVTRVTGTAGYFVVATDAETGARAGAGGEKHLTYDYTGDNYFYGGKGGDGSLDAGGAVFLIAPTITIGAGFTINTSAGAAVGATDGGDGECTEVPAADCCPGNDARCDSGIFDPCACGGGGGGGAGGGPVVLVGRSITNGGTNTTSGGTAGSIGAYCSGNASNDCRDTQQDPAVAGSDGPVYIFDVDDETVTVTE